MTSDQTKSAVSRELSKAHGNGPEPPFLLEPKNLSRKKAVQRRSKQTVATIIEAASKVLSEMGEDAVTTTAVADRAGYSVGTVYQYFPHRDALFVALAERERALIAEEMQSCIAALEAAREQRPHAGSCAPLSEAIGAHAEVVVSAS